MVDKPSPIQSPPDGWWKRLRAGTRNPQNIPPVLLAILVSAWHFVSFMADVDFLFSLRNEKLAFTLEIAKSYWWFVFPIAALWIWGQSRSRVVKRKAKLGAWSLAAVIGIAAFLFGVLLAVLGNEPTFDIMSLWGGSSGFCVGTIKTQRLLGISRKYDVALMCGISNASVDRFKDTAVTVSPTFTIYESDINISTPYSGVMQKEIQKRAGSLATIWILPIVVPKGTDMTRISCLSDVPKVGGRILHGWGTATSIVN